MARRRRRTRKSYRRNPGAKLPWLWILGGGAALFLFARSKKKAETAAVVQVAQAAETQAAQTAQGEYIAVG